MHQGQLPRAIELQTRDAFAVSEDGVLAEVPQLAAIEEGFQDVLLNIQIVVSYMRCSALFPLGISVSFLPPLPWCPAKTESGTVVYSGSRSVKPSEMPRQEVTKLCRRSSPSLCRCASTFLALRVFPFLRNIRNHGKLRGPTKDYAGCGR